MKDSIDNSDHSMLVDCSNIIKQEIKEEEDETEIEINPFYASLTVKNEYFDESETESLDCQQKIKVEIKEEIQEPEDLQENN